jgi:predicted dehydrogenase
MQSSLTKTEKLSIGFLGVGWIGRHRMKALASSEFAAVAIVADANPDIAIQAAKDVDGAFVASSFEELLQSGIDGLVIATPSALHAQQAIAALVKGIPVFCQKPLGRNLEETRLVVEAARKADCLLGVDFCYRFTAFRKVYELIKSGSIGEVYAVDLVFQNAYGPDKAWFYDPQLSGGGCVVDLGVHLVDLALWALDFPDVKEVKSSLFHQGKNIKNNNKVAEDYAAAQFETTSGTLIRLTCSWNLSAGKDAQIEAIFYGTKGAAAFKNVNGSFYDFKAQHYQKTLTTDICLPPDEWGGRAINYWAEKLYLSGKFDKQAEEFCAVAEVIDKIYEK